MRKRPLPPQMLVPQNRSHTHPPEACGRQSCVVIRRFLTTCRRGRRPSTSAQLAMATVTRWSEDDDQLQHQAARNLVSEGARRGPDVDCHKCGDDLCRAISSQEQQSHAGTKLTISCSITLPNILTHKTHIDGTSWIAANVGLNSAERAAHNGSSKDDQRYVNPEIENHKPIPDDALNRTRAMGPAIWIDNEGAITSQVFWPVATGRWGCDRICGIMFCDGELRLCT